MKQAFYSFPNERKTVGLSWWFCCALQLGTALCVWHSHRCHYKQDKGSSPWWLQIESMFKKMQKFKNPRLPKT